jgi:hypothetical protein
VLRQFDVEHIDAGELLEQAPLAFHHGLAGERPDVAQTQHGRPVGDDANEIAARGVFEGKRRIGLDVQARVRNARRIGQRQVALVDNGLVGVTAIFPLKGARWYSRAASRRASSAADVGSFIGFSRFFGVMLLLSPGQGNQGRGARM